MMKGTPPEPLMAPIYVMSDAVKIDRKSLDTFKDNFLSYCSYHPQIQREINKINIQELTEEISSLERSQLNTLNKWLLVEIINGPFSGLHPDFLPAFSMVQAIFFELGQIGPYLVEYATKTNNFTTIPRTPGTDLSEVVKKLNALPQQNRMVDDEDLYPGLAAALAASQEEAHQHGNISTSLIVPLDTEVLLKIKAIAQMIGMSEQEYYGKIKDLTQFLHQSSEASLKAIDAIREIDLEVFHTMVMMMPQGQKKAIIDDILCLPPAQAINLLTDFILQQAPPPPITHARTQSIARNASRSEPKEEPKAELKNRPPV